MSEKNKVGRKPIPIVYKDIVYNNKNYVIGIISSINGIIKFVFDKDDEEKVKGKSWHITSAGYISSYYSNNQTNIKGQLLLHRLILDVPYFPGKGAEETVDHINRNPLDNRKENLRILNQTNQNINQKQKKRDVELPEGCGILPDEIPKHVWYVRANGLHGERFAIEFKTENILWKTTSSKKVSIHEKLNQAKQKLVELYTQHPYLNPDNPERLQTEQFLNNSFEGIVALVNE